MAHDRAWYVQRLSGFGSTDAPVLLGLSRWRTGRDLIEEKIRRVIPDDTEPERIRLRIGREMEPMLIRHAAELAISRGFEPSGASIRRASRLYRSPYWDCVIAHPDGFIGRHVLEIKTDAFGFEPWGDEDGEPSRVVPPMYYAQVQHELAATNRERAFLFVLIGLHERRLYEIPIDDDFVQDLVDVELEAWKNVEDGRRRLADDPTAALDDLLPDIDGSTAATNWLAKRYPADTAEIILPATAEQEQLIREYRDAVRQTAADELHEESLKNRLKDVIKDNAGISSSLGTVTWKTTKDSTVVGHEEIAKAYREGLRRVAAIKPRDVALALGLQLSARMPIPDVEAAVVERLDAIESVFTTTKPGSRRFDRPRSWTKKGGDVD